MNPKKLTVSLAVLTLALASSAQAQTVATWIKTPDGDFFLGSNWDTGTVPDVSTIASIKNGGKAIIGVASGDRKLAGLRLGETQGSTESGHVVMNGGFLDLSGNQGDPKAVIGFSTVLSTFDMDGGTIYFDGPNQFPGSYSDDGVNGLDWEVGEKGKGYFHMTGTAIFRGGDDLKIGANAAAEGAVLIEGSAWLSVGSGISVSEGGPNPIPQLFTIAGNAKVDSGNSMGAGNPEGSTDEGYLTMAAGADSTGRLVVQDNAILQFRRLSARQGNSYITVKDKAQVHIFDLMQGDGSTPEKRPTETGPNSTFVSQSPGYGELVLQDDAQMTVNSDPVSGPTKGLAISGPRDAGNAAGTASMTVKDRASFSVVQDLAIGTGAADTSIGTLEVVGPDTKVQIGNNLSLAVDLDGIATPGKATFASTITGSKHSTVNVANIARIANGHLKVKLNGYKPTGGESYTLIKAGSFDGQFLSTDTSEAALVAGLNWEVQYNTDSVVLKVTGTPVGPKTITVTTTSDVPVAGQKTLAQALTEAGDGDTINFNIPGAGPHYLKTPAGGYPLLKVSNLTIDGYSQPGSSPNTNPILAANNAKIKIVLDSRNGNSTLLDFAGDTPNDSTGYGDTEAAILGFYQGKGNVVRGLCLLAVPLTGANQDISLYGVSFAKGANGHVNGCWIGVDLDGKTKPFIAPADGVTGFRYRGRDEANVVTNVVLVSGVTVGVAKGSKNPRSEFNVIAGVPGIPVILEGENHRFSGNFFGVLPDGKTDFNVAQIEELKGFFEGYIEIGRAGNNTIIGVDDDGVNDADERNVFGGMLPESLGGYNHTIEFYGQTPGTNIVVAGNLFGVGVDGTRFVNAVSPLNAPGGSAVYQFGSDLDGVSDDLEGNRVYNYWPAATLAQVVDAGAIQPFFSELGETTIVSLRGNELVNNYTPPVNPLKNDGAFLTNYYTRFVKEPGAGLVPTLSPSTTVRRIVGTLPVPSASYPVAMVDVYTADAEGLATGKTVDAALYPNGWIQGAKYLASFVDNGIGDKDPAVGSFDITFGSDLCAEGTLLTITANYSASPAGTRGAITGTTLFSLPVAAKASGDALKTALIKPTEALPVTLPDGSVTFGSAGSLTIAGPGLVAWPAASNADQPGDVQEFAYEEITGDFDISAKVTSVTSGPVTDPVDAWASGGLQARESLRALSPSFLVNVGNPKGVNEVRAIGRAIASQNYTTFGRTYPGVDKTLPSQWVRLRRVGNWFAAYVGTDGSSWALIGQRWQEWPQTLLVGAYAFSASYNAQDQTGGQNLATVAFSNYGKTVQNDNTAPTVVSAATMGKKVVGVKFSEPVASAGALVASNYTLSQGTVTAVSGGIGGDSVYLSVSGLTADTFDVTVNNVTDTAGNKIAAGSKVTGRSSAWKSTDIGLIQSGNPDVRTAGDDPYRIGQAVAVASSSTETEIEIIGGGSNAWNPGDYIHYVSGVPLVGDFEVTVEVSRNDRPANTAAWANSGLMLRESEYLPGQQYTQDGTKVAMVANTTYIEGSAPNRAGIPLWREEPSAGYGNGNPGFAWTTPIGGIKGYYLGQRAIDAAGTPDPESSPLSSRWLRIKRAGNDFTFFVSYDGREWALLDGPKTLPLSNQLIFGFSTMSDTGSGAPPNNAYGGNGFLGTDLEGQQNPSNYSVQRIRIGTNVVPRGGGVTPTVSIQGSTVTFTGKLQEATSLNGPFTDVSGATSPYQVPVGSQIKFYRASN